MSNDEYRKAMETLKAERSLRAATEAQQAIDLQDEDRLAFETWIKSENWHSPDRIDDMWKAWQAGAQRERVRAFV